MKLELLLRSDFNLALRPILIKTSCEHCGETNNLELHHVTQFAKLLSDTLLKLGLEYKDTEQYTPKELNMIKDSILVAQIRNCTYLTLCTKCHKEIEVLNFKDSLARNILNNNIDITSFTYNKCKKPEEAVKQLEDEFLIGEITLEELIIECMGIGFLHPTIGDKK